MIQCFQFSDPSPPPKKTTYPTPPKSIFEKPSPPPPPPGSVSKSIFKSHALRAAQGARVSATGATSWPTRCRRTKRTWFRMQSQEPCAWSLLLTLKEWLVMTLKEWLVMTQKKDWPCTHFC